MSNKECSMTTCWDLNCEGNTCYSILPTSSPRHHRIITASSLSEKTPPVPLTNVSPKTPELESHRSSLENQITIPRRASIDQSISHPGNTNTLINLVDLQTNGKTSTTYNRSYNSDYHAWRLIRASEEEAVKQRRNKVVDWMEPGNNPDFSRR